MPRTLRNPAGMSWCALMPDAAHARQYLPPGPGTSMADQSAAFTHRPYAFFDECRAVYGSEFTLRMVGLPPMVVVSDPALVTEVLDTPEVYLGGAGNRATSVHIALGEHFLLALDGQAHADLQRRLLGIMAVARAEGMPRVRELTLARVHAWPIGGRIELAHEMQMLAIDIVLTMLLGHDRHHQRAELARRIHHLVGTSLLEGEPSMIRSSLAFFPARIPIYELLDVEIAHRQRVGRGNRTDALSMLIEPDAGAAAGRLSHVQIRDQLLSMTVAGYDTTATTLAWALHYALGDAAAMASIREDCLQVAGCAQPTPSFLMARQALTDLVNETARLQPVSPIVNRMTSRNTRLGRWQIPKGTMVCPALYLLHRDAIFGPDAHLFRHDRRPARQREHFMPFGGGERRCIGQTFARPEMNLVLGIILGGCDLRLLSRESGARRRGFVVIPDSGVPAVCTARQATIEG